MQNYLLYSITVVIWGSTWLAIKFQLGFVPPEASIAYRFGLAAALLMGYVYIRKLPMRFNLQDHGFFALQGFLLFSLNYILVYLAEQYLTSGLVSIIFSMIIVLNVIFGAIFLRNPIRPRVVGGAALGLIGLIIVFRPELTSFDLTSSRTLGILMCVGGTISASLGNIVSARNQRAGIPVIQSNAFGMTYGAIFMFILALVRGVEFNFDPSFSYVGSLLFLAIFGSIVAFGTYLTLLGRIGPDRAAYVTVLFPIIALILSTLFEGLSWDVTGLAGVLFVLGGNLVVLQRFNDETYSVSSTAESQFREAP
jgi:drug/metabolite transporter (DMT)-like permease